MEKTSKNGCDLSIHISSTLVGIKKVDINAFWCILDFLVLSQYVRTILEHRGRKWGSCPLIQGRKPLFVSSIKKCQKFAVNYHKICPLCCTKFHLRTLRYSKTSQRWGVGEGTSPPLGQQSKTAFTPPTCSLKQFPMSMFQSIKTESFWSYYWAPYLKEWFKNL